MKNLKLINKKGKFIVIYGANNVGKSVQTKLLSNKIISEGYALATFKYPVYNLQPTGPKINQILRHPETLKQKVSEIELQKIFAKNRKDFQVTVLSLLNAGINILAEDYTGTGIAWGMTRDLSLLELEKINTGLIKPDLAILLDGTRFLTTIEKGHRNETDKDEMWLKNRQIHLQLAERYNWRQVKANQTIEKVHKDIWQAVSPVLSAA